MIPKDPIKALKAALTEYARIDLNATHLHCEMVNNSILIDGTVEKISQKKRALFHAMGLSGVAGVIDRLKVKPSMHMSDAEIKNHVYDAFESEQALKEFNLGVEVKDGIVDIEGKVFSLSHKRLAGALAWWVPGSLDVINSIEVVPPEEDRDDEVTDAIKQILEKDRLVDASSIRVNTVNWVVTLEGVTGSEEEKEAAEDDAWYTWGVNEVINMINVEPGTIHELP
ncbi:MAG: BON domain-containing protein [Deltaproteobacteria bacterium]|nr:BON domain-containing protein [Deltaproteobacteria bacterium]